MFEKLFTNPATLARHQNAPYRAERERYLTHCAGQGYARSTLLLLARELLWVARKINFNSESRITVNKIKAVATRWSQRERNCGQSVDRRWTRIRFVQVARQWLRFLGTLDTSTTATPFANLLDQFASWMDWERGLSATTIERYSGYGARFLRWFGAAQTTFSAVRLEDVDTFLAHCGGKGMSRVSVRNVAMGLRSFFRYAAKKGWCPPIADAIHGPRVFPLETLPLGPSWQDVSRLLANMDTDRPADIRDRAIVMLCAIYGLRSSEVANLRLEQLGWEHDMLVVSRAKRRGGQVYPLVAIVGNAVIRYVQTVRPQSSVPQVFLTLLPPFRPLSRGAIYSLVRKQMLSLGIRTAHRGPHSLRHACAAHLVSEGLSLKEIGDYLGHRSSQATRIYAKVNLFGLREVASFDLGDLI